MISKMALQELSNHRQLVQRSCQGQASDRHWQTIVLESSEQTRVFSLVLKTRLEMLLVRSLQVSLI